MNKNTKRRREVEIERERGEENETFIQEAGTRRENPAARSVYGRRGRGRDREGGGEGGMRETTRADREMLLRLREEEDDRMGRSRGRLGGARVGAAAGGSGIAGDGEGDTTPISILPRVDKQNQIQHRVVLLLYATELTIYGLGTVLVTWLSIKKKKNVSDIKILNA